MRRILPLVYLLLPAFVITSLVLGMASVSSPAVAGIFKCIDANGSVTYSQTECEAQQKTAKVMKKSGHATSYTDCSIALPFLKKTVYDMHDGVSSGDVFAYYGGLRKLPKPSLNIINYIYTFKGNDEVLPETIISLAQRKCEAGSFGAVTCGLLPAAFLNEHGGCGVNPNANQNANGLPGPNDYPGPLEGPSRAEAD